MREHPPCSGVQNPGRKAAYLLGAIGLVGVLFITPAFLLTGSEPPSRVQYSVASLVPALDRPETLVIKPQGHGQTTILGGVIGSGQTTPSVVPYPGAEAARASLKAIGDEVKHLPDGSFLLESPASMTVGETKTVRLALTPDGTLQLKPVFSSGYRSVSGHLPTGVAMTANLSSSDFAPVTGGTPETQALGQDLAAEWNWSIHSTHAGVGKITVTVSMRLNTTDGALPLALVTLRKDVTIEVDRGEQVMDFAKDSWQWIAATIVIPLGVFVYEKRASRRRKQKTTPP